MPSVAALRRFDVTPERRALLNTIRFAEGTWRQGKDEGYRVMFGGSLFSDMSRHPNRTIHRWPYSSAAAGAYQFLPTTWQMAKKALKLRDFKPASQDQAAIFLIRRRGALALADRGVLTPELTHKLAPEWASFPKLSGQSYYGQPVRSFRSLKKFYNTNLALVRRDSPAWFAAGPPPALTDQLTALASKPVDAPTRLLPAATSSACDGDLMCLLDYVADGGAPIQPEIVISQS